MVKYYTQHLKPSVDRHPPQVCAEDEDVFLVQRTERRDWRAAGTCSRSSWLVANLVSNFQPKEKKFKMPLWWRVFNFNLCVLQVVMEGVKIIFSSFRPVVRHHGTIRQPVLPPFFFNFKCTVLDFKTLFYSNTSTPEGCVCVFSSTS